MIDEVRQALARHLPDGGSGTVVVLGEGVDHVAYDIDGDLIARWSKEPDPARRAAATRREADLLTAVAEWSTLPVPTPLVTDPDAGVLVYRKLAGVPLLEHPVAAPERLAGPLGTFLSRLHQAPLERVDHLADRDTYPLSAYLADAAGDYDDIVDRLPREDRRLVEDFLDHPPPPEPAALTFCHNDLGSEHLLVDPETGTLTGVIDWADAAITDPAHDLALLYRDLGPVAYDRVLAHYDAPWSDRDSDRAVFLARCALLEDIAYGVRTGAHPYTAAGLDHLTRTFKPHG
jgi:aminoglycoside phosphotransferase (APT) family kinase protein